MKKILPLVALLLILLAAAKSGSAQTISSASYIDSCNFNGTSSWSMYVLLSSPTSMTGCTVETNFGDGTKLDTSSIFIGGSTGYYSWLPGHYYTVTGSYTVKHVLICGGNRIDSITQTVNVNCKVLGGYLYQDVNANCLYDPTESTIWGISKIEVDSAGTVIDTVYGWSYWYYRPKATATTVYKFRLISSATALTATCPSSGLITYTYVPGPTVVTNLNFGFTCSASPTYDFALTYSRALRGASSSGPSYIYLFASNTSCHNGTATVTLNVSPKYTINTASILPAPASVSGNTVTWAVSGLSYVTRSFLVPLTPKSTTNNGDTACYSASITPLSGDVNTANNFISSCDSVRASWDPNEKAVSPTTTTSTAGIKLTYTLDFENLGNDTAFNIHIQDTLSQNLDANSFALIGSTHRVIPQIYQAGGKNILKLDFPGINLEDKNVPTRNKGQVQFTMNLRPGLAPGTVTANRAGIYFDGNPVVITNYATNSISKPESVGGISNVESVRVYPNPAQDAITISVKTIGWDMATLTNTLGQEIRRQPITKGEQVMPVAGLPAGIYYLQLSGSAGALSQKIEKQ